MNRHDGLVGVVFLVCLACVVFAGGVDRPRDVFATLAFADDDENVVHLIPAVVEPWRELLGSSGDEAARVGGVVFSPLGSPGHGFGHWVPAIRKKRQ